MRKLTAGIFTVLMGLVSVNAADAAVASKLYVDQFVGENGSITGKVTALETTVGDENSGLVQDVAALQTDLGKLQGGELTINKDAILTDMIKNGQVTEEKLSTDLQNKVNAAATQTYTDAELAKKVNKADAKLDEVGATGSYIELVSQLDGKVSATKKEFVAEINEASKESTVAPQTKAVKSYVDGAISTQGTQVTQLSGRVGSLETAVSTALNEDTGILAQAKEYADQAELDAISAAGTAADGKISAALADYTTTTDMNTALGLKADKSDTYTKAQVDAAVKVNTDAIAEINDAENGILAQANSYADGKAAEEAQAVADTLKFLATADVPNECKNTDGSNICVLTMTGEKEFAWTPLTSPVDETVDG